MKQLLYLTLAGLLLASCRKPDAVDCGPVPAPVASSPAPTPTPTPPTTTIPASAVSNIALFAFFNKYGPTLQRRGFVIGQSQPIQLAGGASLSVDQVRFLLPGGTQARDSAYLLARELYTVPQIVLGGMHTIDQAGQLMISGGEFYLLAQQRQGGRLASLSTTGSPTLATLTSPIPPEQDVTTQNTYRQATPLADWTRWGSNVQTVGSTYRTAVLLDTIPYFNIDQYFSVYAGGYQTISYSVEVPTTPAGETLVVLRPLRYNGVYRARTSSTGSTAGTTRWLIPALTGYPMKLLVLQSINGQLYASSQTPAITNGAVLTPTLTPMSEADALALIWAL